MKKTRLNQCVRYNLRGLLRASLIFMGIFALIDLVLPIVLYIVLGENIRSGQSSFSYGLTIGAPGSLPFLLATMIFLFVGAYASFRENFNHLLTMNATRQNQFWAATITMLVASGILVVVGVIFGWIETVIQAWIGQRNPAVDVGEIFNGYGQNPVGQISGLLVYLVVLLAAFAFGEVAGVLSYRFGKIFVVPFWICFGASFMVVPITMGTNLGFRQAILWFIGYQQPNQPLVIAFNLLILLLIYKMITFVAIRKLNQAV